MKNLKTITAAAMALTIALGGGVWANQAHAADTASNTIQSELQAKKTFGHDHGHPPGQNQSGDAPAIKVPRPIGGKGGLPGGDHGRPGFHGIQSEELASTLGVTADELNEALRSGKTIAAIAAEKGVDVQTVIDQIVQAHTAQLDQELADGKLTQEQYDNRKAGLADMATKLVNGEAGDKIGFRGDKGGFPGKDGFMKSKRPSDAANAGSGSGNADNDSGSAEASDSE